MIVQPQEAVAGILFTRRLIGTDDCDALVASAIARNEWRPARVGEYERNELIAADVDPEASTAEVTATFTDERGVLSRVRNHASEVAKNHLGLTLNSFSKASMSRYAPGTSVGRHRDTTTFSTHRLVTVILYLNDTFEGGELIFPDIGIKYQPARGDLAIFLSEHFHSVSTIRNGFRFCLIQFGEN